MTSFGDEPDIASFDPVALAAVLRGAVGAGAEVRDRLGTLRGSAETPDGVVRVEVDPQGRLADVRLDPKAMRMPSADLAATIVRLAREAGSDVARQLTAEVGDLRKLAADFDPAAVRAKLEGMSADFARLARDGQERFDDVSRRTR